MCLISERYRYYFHTFKYLLCEVIFTGHHPLTFNTPVRNENQIDDLSFLSITKFLQRD
jgi:hypothetical protein